MLNRADQLLKNVPVCEVCNPSTTHLGISVSVSTQPDQLPAIEVANRNSPSEDSLDGVRDGRHAVSLSAEQRIWKLVERGVGVRHASEVVGGGSPHVWSPLLLASPRRLDLASGVALHDDLATGDLLLSGHHLLEGVTDHCDERLRGD